MDRRRLTEPRPRRGDGGTARVTGGRCRRGDGCPSTYRAASNEPAAQTPVRPGIPVLRVSPETNRTVCAPGTRPDHLGGPPCPTIYPGRRAPDQARTAHLRSRRRRVRNVRDGARSPGRRACGPRRRGPCPPLLKRDGLTFKDRRSQLRPRPEVRIEGAVADRCVRLLGQLGIAPMPADDGEVKVDCPIRPASQRTAERARRHA